MTVLPAQGRPKTGKAALVALKERRDWRYVAPTDHRWVEALAWQPIALREMHLVAQYLPLGIRKVKDQWLLGVLLSRDLVTRQLVDASGRWQAGSLPIALRCFPFQATGTGGTVMTDLVVPRASPFLSRTDGIALLGPGGAPSAKLTELHALACLIRDSRKVAAPFLDHLAIADLLVPLAATVGGGQADCYTISRGRFAALPSRVLAAMGRTAFTSLDIAVACLFSQRHLQAGALDKAADSALPSGPGRPSATPQAAIDLFGAGDVLLDDGDLLSMDDLEAMHVLAPPPEVEAAERDARAQPDLSETDRAL